MPVCDICNEATSWDTGESVSPQTMKCIAANGFDPGVVLKVVAPAGLSKKEAHERARRNWCDNVVSKSTTDWLLCGRCATLTHQYVGFEEILPAQHKTSVSSAKESTPRDESGKDHSTRPTKITAPEPAKGKENTVFCAANRIGFGVAVLASFAAGSWIVVTQASGDARSYDHLAAVLFVLVVLPSWGIWLLIWEQRQTRAQSGIVCPRQRATRNNCVSKMASGKGRPSATTKRLTVPAEDFSGATPQGLPEAAVDTHGDYSQVKDPSGRTCGLWFLDRAVAENKGLLKAFWAKLCLPTEIFEVIESGQYRVVDNNDDKAGGCFVMFGTARAPGERTKSEKCEPFQDQIPGASRIGISNTSPEGNRSQQSTSFDSQNQAPQQVFWVFSTRFADDRP